MKSKLVLRFLSVVLILATKSEGGGGPSDQPIATTPPNFPGGQIANDAPPGPFLRDFAPPFPTDAWWSGFTVANQDAHVAGPFPYQCATLNNGLVFGSQDTREFDGTSIRYWTEHDWRVFIAGPETLQNRKATSWDTQTVCLQYDNGLPGATMDTCLVPGSPYMTFKFTNAAILITSEGGPITSFEWALAGQKVKVTTSNGKSYLLYIIEGTADLTADGFTITSPPGTSATIRFARIKDSSQETILDTHSSVYSVGLDMRYAIQGNVGTVTWTWDVVGDPAQLLLLSWPHHRSLLNSPEYVPIEYMTLKGTMSGVVGNVWSLRYNLPTISWFPENPVHSSCRNELVKIIEHDVDHLVITRPGDFYFWGGNFAKASRLALIAEHINRPDLVDKVIPILKESINHWFDPAHEPAAAFETGWGGVINKLGWNDSWVDFGNAYYNDHHFHYGYFLQGAATIGRYDRAWLNEHIDFLTHIARDIGNPSPSDPHHTVTRHMDFFAGHSWASGIHNGAGSRDQESSTEAVNGYYGLLLFAEVTNNQLLIDWARLLLAIEIKGAQVYWHLYPSAAADATPYPEQDLRALTTMGNVMDWQAGAWLFWGDQRTQIAAIQILPLTPMGQVTYDKEWMENVLPYCQAEIDDATIGDPFKSVIVAAYAAVSPQQAYTLSSDLFDWGTGNSASNQLYFVATQPSTSDICSVPPEVPEGLFLIQEVESGLYITVERNGFLVAAVNIELLASRFVFAFTPGGSTIESTGRYVTAAQDGLSPISAIRDTPYTFEVFRWLLQPDGTYHLRAMVNRAEITLTPDGKEMINNANSTNGVTPSKFRLIRSENTPPTDLPASGKLQSVSNGRFVISTGGEPTLLTTGTEGTGTRFSFAIMEASPEETPYYSIQNLVSDLFVTASPDGSYPLIATAPFPQAWEEFEIFSYQDAYLLVHVQSGMTVGVQPDDTLLDDGVIINDSHLWRIVP